MNRLLTILSLMLFLTVAGTSCQFVKTVPPTGTSPAQSQRGGTLNLYGTDPSTLDPARSGEVNSVKYVLQIFSGLVALDKNLSPTPDIAQEWDVSPDGETYTFRLREEAKFQGGRRVTAQDFKYSWERACSPSTASPTAATYLGDIVGVKEMLSGKATALSGVTAVDDSTLRVQIIEPKSYFLFKLTYPVAFLVDKENVQAGATWWKKPNGTGPFKLTRWTPGSQLVLERNSLFYGRIADLDSVVFHVLAGLPMNLYETGEIDVSPVSPPYLDRASDTSGPFNSQLVSAPELSFFYIGFNAKQAPFNDANIRRAFSMAVDKAKIVSLSFHGTVAKASGIVPPGIEGSMDNLEGIGFDPAKARDLIKQSEYGDVSKLPAITLTTGGEGGTVAGWLQAVVFQWRENLGVNVKVRQLESDQFFYSLKQEKDNMFDLGWIADYPHQQDFLEVLFRTGSDINYGEYSNPAVDSLLDRAGVESDKAKSVVLYQQAETALVDDAACLPLYFGKNYYLVKPYVRGYRENALGFAMLNEVSIQK